MELEKVQYWSVMYCLSRGKRVAECRLAIATIVELKESYRWTTQGRRRIFE
jgi:hypothetical protein